MNELKLPPKEQVQQFLKWMKSVGVMQIDLQMRIPSSDNPGEWKWLTRQHQSIKIDRVLNLWTWLRHMNLKIG